MATLSWLLFVTAAYTPKKMLACLYIVIPLAVKPSPTLATLGHFPCCTVAPPVDVPKPETPSLPTPKLEAPKLEAPKLEAPKLEAPSLPKPPKVEAPSLPTPSVPTPSTPDLPQQAGMSSSC